MVYREQCYKISKGYSNTHSTSLPYGTIIGGSPTWFFHPASGTWNPCPSGIQAAREKAQGTGNKGMEERVSRKETFLRPFDPSTLRQAQGDAGSGQRRLRAAQAQGTANVVQPFQPPQSFLPCNCPTSEKKAPLFFLLVLPVVIILPKITLRIFV